MTFAEVSGATASSPEPGLTVYESMVIRDLRILAQPLDGDVYHYRDNYGLEIDAIVQLARGE